MSTLTSGDFGQFFEEIWGYPAYTWQQRLLDDVTSSDNWKWPDVIDMPTGSGKTSILDIGLFAMALDAQRIPSKRRMPRRIVLVVDRRVVVDQAGFRGQVLLERVGDLEREPERSPVMAKVSQLLRSLWDDGDSSEGPKDPFSVGILRGGIVRDETWAERPDRPALMTSTVDQIGSRLLFQGYGLSRSARPIHAGLIGVDTLIVLDEVQVAVPFAETLETLQKLERSKDGVPQRWQVIEMSATARQRTERRVTFPNPGDRTLLLSDLEIVRRTSASRLVSLAPVVAMPSNPLKANETFAQAMSDQTMELLSETRKTLAVIVNRVDTARRVATKIRQTHPDSVLLVTGRMRPLDREEVLSQATVKRLMDRSSRTEDVPPLIIVSTQTLEAGADYDFDAIVTECASADSLVQRFGRLDRAGVISARSGHSVGLILIRSSALADEDDPVYRQSAKNTWNWLQKIATENVVDFGINAFPPRGEWPTENCVTSPADQAPLLFPEHLELWHQTNPAPALVPDVAQWLHGIRPVRPEIQIVWRSELDQIPETLTDESKTETEGLLDEILGALPPSASEALTLPIFELRNFLRGGQDSLELADLDGSFDSETKDTTKKTDIPYFAKWADRKATLLNQIEDIRPGDVIVLRCAVGGIGSHGTWDPESKVAVRDLAEVARLSRPERPFVFRLDPQIAGREWLKDHPMAIPSADDLAELDPAQGVELLQNWRSRLPEEVAAQDPTLGKIDVSTGELRRLSNGLNWIVGTKPEPESPGEDETDEASFIRRQVSLDGHLAGVGTWARKLATNVGLPQELIDDLEFAGNLHDLGKADPRFQRWLRNGSPQTVDLIAKSSLPSGDRRQRMAAQKESGYPGGTRHELMSLALIEHDEELRSRAHNWELVCHLVASHHGHCRPFAPTTADRKPVTVEVTSTLVGHTVSAPSNHRLAEATSGVADRFWNLTHTYGWHGLAYLEGLLRLADHRRSAWETETQGASK